jgi:hypothetical protein
LPAPFPGRAGAAALELLDGGVARALVRRAVVVAGNDRTGGIAGTLIRRSIIVACFVVASFMVIAMLVVFPGFVVPGFVIVAVAVAALAGAAIVATMAAVAAFAMIAAAVMVAAALATAILAAVVVAAAFATFAAFGKSLAHSELAVEAYRRGSHEAKGKGRQAGGLQQAAHPALPNLALINRTLPTRNGVHRPILLKGAGPVTPTDLPGG